MNGAPAVCLFLSNITINIFQASVLLLQRESFFYILGNMLILFVFRELNKKNKKSSVPDYFFAQEQ